MAGHVASGSTTAQGFRWKRSVIIVAGPAMNAVMFGVGVLLLPSNLLRAFAIVNGFGLITNLLPFSQQTPLGPQANDGLALVRTLFDPEAELEEQLTGMSAVEAQRLAEAGDRDGATELVRKALVQHPDSRILRTFLVTTCWSRAASPRRGTCSRRSSRTTSDARARSRGTGAERRSRSISTTWRGPI